MDVLSEIAAFERARPLLGTIACVRASFEGPNGLDAIENAFAAIADVQRLMSFFNADSDLSHLHGQPSRFPVQLDALTLQVIDLGLEIAHASNGFFDPCLGSSGVEAGMLPAPEGALHSLAETAGACWRDVERIDNYIILKRPLWLDLSGIAKGFAVDRAIQSLKASGAIQASVNIGGDLAVFGPEAETVQLRTNITDDVPTIEVENMAIASSGGAIDWVKTRHFHRHGQLVDPKSFATVIAPTCAVADALTKVVLASEKVDETLLARYKARALRHTQASGWQIYGRDHG